MKLTMIDYRKLRLRNLCSPAYRHLLLLLYWPLYGLIFWLLERGITRNYIPISCTFDAKIPFCEYFVVPYYFWFVFIIGIILYSMFFDLSAFRRYMWFTILSYTAACLIFILFPNCQELRPVVFERQNLFTQIVAGLYSFDTNTNVCPSLHVIGSVAVLYASWNSEFFSTIPKRIIMLILTILISISTVFLKQHSVLDILAAIPICLIAAPLATIIAKKNQPAKTTAPA